MAERDTWNQDLSPNKRRQWVRTYLSFAVISLCASLVGFLVREDLYRFFGADPRFVLAVVAALLLQSVTFFLMLYLRGDLSIPLIEKLTASENSPPSVSTDFARRSRELASTLKDMRRDLSELQARIASNPSPAGAIPAEIDRILESLREHVTETLAAEIESRVHDRVKEEIYVSNARETHDAASVRLRQEIESLTRRGNVNLIIGVVTTCIAVGLLVYMVLTATDSFSSWPQLLSHYIPRVTTVVFIEVFSFFFLRLYRSSLSEIKYYQNELTTLDAQRIALEAAGNSRDPKALASVISSIGRTNRNHNSEKRAEEAVNSKDLKEAADVLENLAKVVSSTVRRAGSSKDEE
jgi:hypothetical protein